MGDCGAAYNPSLYVDTTPISYTAQAGAGNQSAYFIVNNRSGGVMNWTATINYTNGSGWLILYPNSGTNNGTVRVDAVPGTLRPGPTKPPLPSVRARSPDRRLYRSRSLSIPFRTQRSRRSSMQRVSRMAPLARVASVNSREQLPRQSCLGRFDGLPAQVLFSNASQINILVPAALAGQSSSQLVVTVDGLSSIAQTLALTPSSPAIFSGGVLNQNSSVNFAANPAGWRHPPSLRQACRAMDRSR